MALEYISLDIVIPDLLDQYSIVIENAIQERGEPIRWAITAIKGNIFQIEAVVQVKASRQKCVARVSNSHTGQGEF